MTICYQLGETCPLISWVYNETFYSLSRRWNHTNMKRFWYIQVCKDSVVRFSIFFAICLPIYVYHNAAGWQLFKVSLHIFSFRANLLPPLFISLPSLPIPLSSFLYILVLLPFISRSNALSHINYCPFVMNFDIVQMDWLAIAVTEIPVKCNRFLLWMYEFLNEPTTQLGQVMGTKAEQWIMTLARLLFFQTIIHSFQKRERSELSTITPVLSAAFSC